MCRNPSLGVANQEWTQMSHFVIILTLGSRPKPCKNVGQEGRLKGTSYTPKNARECERMNFHTPKWAPTLGASIQMDSQMFMEQL
jgi:hypothetical protein